MCGILPTWLGLTESCAHSLLLSLVLCYGGGVLFSTSLLHIMPEARQSLPDTSDLVLCAGFMFLYLTEEINKIFDNKNYSQQCKLEVESLLDGTVHHRYDSVSHCKCAHDENKDVENAIPKPQDIKRSETNDVILVQPNTIVKNRFGLLLAFTVHSVIEGMAIGIQPIPGKVLLLLGAVLTHKLVVAFCLGAELASDGRSFASLNRCLMVYAVGSAVGIPFGIGIDRSRSSSTTSTIIPVLQGLAAGSLLYITVSEILPRERSRWQHQKHLVAGLLQFFVFCLGFITILLLLIFI